MKDNRHLLNPSPTYSRQVVLLVCFILGIVHLNAQKMEPAPSTFHIGVKDGLPSSETYYVHQDKRGYMWFCTDRGVVKYDGFRVQVYNKSNGLPDDVVFKIIEDEKGRIWFYLYNGTLAYYDHQKAKMLPYKYNNQLKKMNHGDFNGRKSFSIGKYDDVYYTGLYECGRIDRNGKLFTVKRTPLRKLVEVNGNWMDYGGFNTAANGELNIQVVPEKGKTANYTYSGSIVKLFDIQRVNEHCFVSINDRVCNVSRPSEEVHFSGYTGMYDVNGELWITTLTGAYRFKNPDNMHLSRPDGLYLKNQKITAVERDQEGGYWFSTLDDGIQYTSCLDIINWIPGKEKGTIHDINGIGNKVYYSSAFGYYDLKTGEELMAIRGPRNVIGVWGNQLIFSNNIPFFKGQKVTRSNWGLQVPQFQGWAVDRTGDFYTTYVMTSRIRKQTAAIEMLVSLDEIYNPENYAAHYFKSMVFDENNKLYLGSLIGLFTIHQGKIKKIQLPSDLNSIRITDLKFHPAWGVVAATRGRGVFILKNGKVVGRIQKEDGLLSDQTNTIHLDKEGSLYVGTNKGLSKIVQVGLHRVEVFNLTELNGLSSSEVSTIFSNKDGVYVGTREGITLIPASYKWFMSEHREQIGIQTVFANGKRVTDFKSGMEFNASHKVLRFLLQTTNYKSLHRQPYKYRFRKTDSWSTGFNGELILINPVFESYELEVQYQNECGSWSKPYILTSFSILPPFYSTWWFTVLIVLLVLSIGFLFFRNRIQVIHSRNVMQAEMKELEQKALLAQMNPHFIFNSLNSIQSFLIFNENELAERYLLKLSQLIRMTLTNSRESEISIEKELEILQKYIELEQMRFKDRFDFTFENALSPGDLNKNIPPMLVQPFVENSIIHGFKSLKEGGKIIVRFLRIEHQVLLVEVEDNGIGYQDTPGVPNPEHKSYGTKITQERLTLFQQKYEGEFQYSIESIQDENGNPAGTLVKMSIPVI